MMADGPNHAARDQFLPIRNTQYSRHVLLKKQREQILKVRQINLVAQSITLNGGSANPFYTATKNCKKCQSSPSSERNRSRMTLPNTYRNPYTDSRACLYSNAPSPQKIKPDTAGNNNKGRQLANHTKNGTVKRNQEFYELRQCYRKIFNDDVESFKLLLKNQEQFGKPKIPLTVNSRSPQQHTSPTHVRSRVNVNNSFPKKRAPYVPHTFLRSSRKEKKTVSPAQMDQLINNKPPIIHNQQQLTQSPDQKVPKITEPSTVVINLSDEHSDNNNSSSMSREEFISINQQMMDDDLMQVPTADGLLLSRSSSSVSNIVEEMIKDNKIKVSDEDNKEKTVYKNDTDMNGLFPTPPVDLEVLDENGEKKNIVWHDPEADMKQHEVSEALLDSSKTLAARRKSEIKQLLEEYSNIAQELEKMEVQ